MNVLGSFEDCAFVMFRSVFRSNGLSARFPGPEPWAAVEREIHQVTFPQLRFCAPKLNGGKTVSPIRIRKTDRSSAEIRTALSAGRLSFDPTNSCTFGCIKSQKPLDVSSFIGPTPSHLDVLKVEN